MTRFVHLHTHSHYSLLDGLAKIDDLIARTKEFGMDALALTDHGNLYGAIEFYKKAKKAGIKPILGVEAYLAPGARGNREESRMGRAHENGTAKGRLPYYHLILLAKNNTGWKNLLRLVTRANLEGFYYKPRMDKEILREHHEGLIALSACLTGEIPRLLSQHKAEEAEAALREYQDIFGTENFYLEIGTHPNIPDTVPVREALIRLARKTGTPLVATQDIHYAKREDAEYHDILLAVQTGSQLSDTDRLTLKDDDFSLQGPEHMAALFADIPEAILTTAKIADMCDVELPLGKIHLPSFPLPAGTTPRAQLRALIRDRLPERYPEETKEIADRVGYELGVIEKTGFADYFLIVQDFIGWAKTHGIVVGPGRGSSAGSIVSYILGITDLDPLKYDLLFERFLNPDRNELPDFDVDFADTRRDEVLAYVKEKYGEDHVAQIITFGTMAARAAIRDAGRALSIPLMLCDRLAKLVPFNAKLNDALKVIPELAEQYGINPDARRVLDAARHLDGVARHASVHACGVVISKEPLIEHVALQKSPQDENAVITQFEMHAIEDLGLLKMDFLGLKNLSIIEGAVSLIRDTRGEETLVSQLPQGDKKTYALLRAGETTGVFQFESSGMRRYLKELRPSELEDLIAMVSLYRPGPMELIPSYIRRKHGEEAITYLHPKLEPILKNTYGVGIYQEQMMRIARDLAGFTLAEADTLRKAIGKKIKSLLNEQKEKLIGGMITNGIAAETAAAIWELFPPFARYGFNRSHAACYAMIGYQTAYLRAHYPVEFMAALLNADTDDIDRISFLMGEARRFGIEILPPDINRSATYFAPDGNAIRFGLLAIKNVGIHIVQTITENRARGGPFLDLADLLRRIQHKDLNKKSLECLVKCGALDSLGIERSAALENIEELLKFAALAKRASEEMRPSLFGLPTANAFAMKLAPAAPATSKEKLLWEKELLGLYVSDHPLNQHRARIQSVRARTIKDALNEKSERTRFSVAGIISAVKKITTKTGQPMLFARIEDLSDAIEVIAFSDTLARAPDIWKENNAILMGCRMSLRNGEPKLICESAQEL
ncbi:MAG: DNA polymerase III subunit alpha [bacterium]|nr:DNA polymerase III subunit alpha [bacterium]